MGTGKKIQYVNLLFIASIALLILWLVMDLLYLYSNLEWAIYARTYSECLFYIAIALNIVAILLKRKYKI